MRGAAPLTPPLAGGAVYTGRTGVPPQCLCVSRLRVLLLSCAAVCWRHAVCHAVPRRCSQAVMDRFKLNSIAHGAPPAGYSPCHENLVLVVLVFTVFFFKS